MDTEIPSPAAGTLAEILVEEGKTVGINTVVGRIARAMKPRHSPAAASRGPLPPQLHLRRLLPPTVAEPPTRTPPPRPLRRDSRPNGGSEETAGPLSPLVRKMARENNIDLSR